MAEELKKSGAAAPTETGELSLIDQLIETTRVKPGDEAYSITRQGIQAFITELLEPQRAAEKVSGATVDDMIAMLDAKLCRQVDAVMHNSEFQKLESAWRSLKFPTTLR